MQQTTPIRTAYLLMGLGGAGGAALEIVSDLLRTSNASPAVHLARIDTDMIPAVAGIDAFCMPVGAAMEPVMETPGSFGSTVSEIVEGFEDYLDPDDMENGARTLRALTQAAALVKREELAAFLNNCLRKILTSHGANRVIPVLISSSGGGTGSALSVLLPDSLQEPGFRARVLEGLSPKLLAKPVLIVAEPFAHALRNSDEQANDILANAYALRLETAELERRGALKYVIHLGMTNESGAMLDTLEELWLSLGATAARLILHWQQLKSRFVDTLDRAARHHRYAGKNLPEQCFSSGSGESRGSDLPEGGLS
ncbi:MAG: hypothetical protein JNJ88_00215 [Planctomycetes bacterium]|nr:hypothetical protein [Planctomycetota bacterium]